MAAVDQEMNVVEAAVMDENMNCSNTDEYAKGTGVRKKELTNSGTSAIDSERKKKFFQKYFYQQDYQEALRSLLWEPYDCRNNEEEENCDAEEEDVGEDWCLLGLKVPKRKLSSSESISSSSSEGACALDKRTSWPVCRRPGGIISRARRGRSGEEWVSSWSSGACDLDRHCRDSSTWNEHQGALLVETPGNWQRQCVRDPGAGGVYEFYGEMASGAPGVLEPPDSTESSKLVNSAVLDNRPHPPASVHSSASVSVVNCYRAVPVAVVSSVPTIKCLNTQQENVSNVNVVQTYVRPMRGPPAVPSTSKSRPLPRPNSVHVGLPPTNDTTLLTNHNRSVSNPVLGQYSRSSPSRYGSQQNLPIRVETHFGENLEQSHTFTRPPPPPQEVNVIHNNPSVQNEPPKPRTFTSTEAQTDEIVVPLSAPLYNITNREQRRRERRERRHQRRMHQSALQGATWQTAVEGPGEIRGLPDILHSHLPPPYLAAQPLTTPLPPVHPVHVQVSPPVPPPSPSIPHLVDPAVLVSAQQHPGLFPFPFTGSGRRSRLSPRTSGYVHEEDSPKSCCGVVVTQAVSIRWFIVMIAFVGICCVTVGTVLGAMKASGREHLTVSLLMIGVGIVLVTVSVVAWRLTSQDAPSCRSMLGLGSGDDSSTEPNRRFVPRMPPSYGRPHHPYAAMMYPEFQYRPPPPSYQASMQDYRLRLLLLDRNPQQGAVSPPPVYRSHAGSALGLRAPTLCRSLPQSEYSHPPSYRSRTSSTRPSLDPTGGSMGSVVHSRDPSLISHVSDANGNAMELPPDVDLQLDSLKIGVNDVPIPPLRMLLNGKGGKSSQQSDSKLDQNLVTIVTVSDVTPNPPVRNHSLDNDVLAHL